MTTPLKVGDFVWLPNPHVEYLRHQVGIVTRVGMVDGNVIEARFPALEGEVHNQGHWMHYQRVGAALAEIARLQRERDQRLAFVECVWTLEDEDAPCWDTSCGHAFQFMEDGPAENKQKFCGYCGGTLIEKRRTP